MSPAESFYMDDSGVDASTPRGKGEEETSPDLLRNTPSNIARLEDFIEHSEGRHKYLAQTRSPSDGSDVRWYFCKVPLAENGKLVNVNLYFDLVHSCDHL